MAENSADLSGSEREQRIAELKAKMQASAKKNKAQAEAPAKAAQEVKAAAGAAVVVADAPAVVVTGEPTPAAVSAAHAKSNGAATNGATMAAELAQTTTLAAPEPVFVEDSPEVKARKEMTRREFMTYAWGGALGLLALQGAAGLFFFMMPRFKAGEFGGVFFIGPESAMPATDAPPEANVAGKFWLVNTTDEGIKALYMVCTHLGCLYKWEQANFRFECPCHGSKFTREGYYIEGPAPRSLDTFLVTVENGEVAVDTGKKTLGSPSSESPARAVPV
ncbi:MAG TPA: Rieske 2Fe-2S domain-containing protein [Chloroflexi bacterium]|nr:Rieske 2Fe-2S domain-containing protein [Chloroflexota bacterium]